MNKKTTADSFAYEVRKMVSRYALFPVLLSYAILSVVVLALYSYTIRYSVISACRTSAYRLSKIVSSYEEEMGSIQDYPGIKDVLERKAPINDFSKTIYDFIKTQDVQGEFFLLDLEGKPVVSSTTVLSEYMQSSNSRPSLLSLVDLAPQKNLKFVSNIGTPRAYSMVLTLGRAIVKDNTIIGYFFFELPPEGLLDYSRTGEVGDLMITNAFNSALYSTQNEFIDSYSKLKADFRTDRTGAKNINGSRYFIHNEYVPDLDFRVIGIVCLDFFSKMLNATTAIGFVLMLVSVLLIRYGSTKIISQESQNIDSMLERIDTMKEKGIYSQLEPTHSSFRSLETSYNELVDRIRDLVESNRQQVILRERAEIRQLEAQLSPHFLFNTLEIIRCLIKTDPKAANRMILDLSFLLRYSIDTSREFATLEQAEHYLENYLSMNKLGRCDNLDYRIRIEDGLEDMKIPKLCMQPLIENSIKYSPKNQPLMITIDIDKIGNELITRVSDNGTGIPAEELTDIKDILEQEEIPDRYFGLYSIHRRLRLTYGRRAGLSLTSDDKGTVVTLTIPQEE